MAELYPWQQQLITAMNKYQGRGPAIITGRRQGKSMAQSAYKRLFDDIYNRPVEDLKLSEGTVYGSRYYTVEPVGGSWIDMETWCLDTYGATGKHIWGSDKAPDPALRWYMNNRKFWFKNEKDRTMFILRWSR